MKAPLAGLSAVELSGSLAGVHVGQLLADFGAEVVLVENPGGSRLRREAAWPFWARGKRSVVLDLASASDLRAAQALAEGADVVIETFRPGVAERLGLDHASLARANPRLIHASISGFGRSGPLANVPGYEGVVMAKLGAFGAQAHLTKRPGPSFIAAPFCAFSSAQLALQGILAALLERERSGRGQHVETTLVQGLLAHDTWNWLIRFVAHKYTGAYRSGRPISERGVPNTPLMFRLVAGLTKDGRWLQFSQSADHLYAAFLRACGLEWLATDPRWSKAPAHEDESEREAYWEKLLEGVRAKTYAEWQALFDRDTDVWAERFRRGTELLDHPQLRHDGQVLEVDDPERGPVLQPGPLVRLDATPAPPTRPAPRLDADGAALRARAAAASPSPSDPPAVSAPSGPPLAGITVLELGTFFAGPYGATLLADLGARVIKLEERGGDPLRRIIPFPEVGGVKVLSGKESVAVDLASPEGREIAHVLARRADVVLRSFRAGVAERLGLDAKTLLALNPRLVYLDAPGYGTDGPCGHRPAFAPTIAAATGLSTRIAGPAVPERPDLTLDEVKSGGVRLFSAGAFLAQSDGFAALGVATALLLGLVARARGAPGQRMLTTMLSTVAHALSEDMVRWHGRPPAAAPDPELFGLGALYRLYAAAEGWVFLAVTNAREWAALSVRAEFAELAADPRFRDEAARQRHDAALADQLAAIFATRAAADWERELVAAGVACVVASAGPVEAAITDPDGLARACGFVIDVEHPTLERHPRLAPAWRFSRSACVTGSGPALGQHTDAVLRELGYAEERIAELRERGVVGSA